MRRGNRLLSAHLVGLGGGAIASVAYGRRAQEDGVPLCRAVESLVHLLQDMGPGPREDVPLAVDCEDVRILAERGRHCLLVVVLEGREDAILRVALRDILDRLEERLAVSLPYRGQAEVCREAREALEHLGSATQVL